MCPAARGHEVAGKPQASDGGQEFLLPLHAFADPGMALFRTLASKVNDLAAGDNEWVVRWPHNHRAMMRWDAGKTAIP